MYPKLQSVMAAWSKSKSARAVEPSASCWISHASWKASREAILFFSRNSQQAILLSTMATRGCFGGMDLSRILFDSSKTAIASWNRSWEKSWIPISTSELATWMWSFPNEARLRATACSNKLNALSDCPAKRYTTAMLWHVIPARNLLLFLAGLAFSRSKSFSKDANAAPNCRAYVVEKVEKK